MQGWHLLVLTFVLLVLFEPGYAAEVVDTLFAVIGELA